MVDDVGTMSTSNGFIEIHAHAQLSRASAGLDRCGGLVVSEDGTPRVELLPQRPFFICSPVRLKIG